MSKRKKKLRHRNLVTNKLHEIGRAWFRKVCCDGEYSKAAGWENHPHLGRIIVTKYVHTTDCPMAPGEEGADPITVAKRLKRVQSVTFRRGPREEIW